MAENHCDAVILTEYLIFFSGLHIISKMYIVVYVISAGDIAIVGAGGVGVLCHAG